MIGQSCFHRRSDPQRLVNPAKVVVHEVERNRPVILKFLAESVRQPREPPHAHPHRQIAALDE